MTSFERLPSFHKKVYPFRLAAPSYVYPADWWTNAELIGPHVDEIELLLLESHSETCFPSPTEIEALSTLSKTHSFSYNVHLPSDISLSDPDPDRRSAAVEKLSRVIFLTAPLAPSTWTLHLPFDRKEKTPEVVSEWQDSNREGLQELLHRTGIPGGSLSIETLFYPFGWITEVVRSLHLSVCMDTGHLMIKEVDIEKLYAELKDIITILHVHGVTDHEGGRYGDRLVDHVSLNLLNEERGKKLLSLLDDFKGIVSIETFSFHNVKTSLEWLSEHRAGARHEGKR